MLIREGSVVPLNVAQQYLAQPADSRGFMVAPQAAAPGAAQACGRLVTCA